MSITITLPPELEEVVRKQAAVRGERLEVLASTLLAQSILAMPAPPTTTLEEFEHDWDELFTPIEGLPDRPECNYTREDIYFDHD